MADGTTSVEYHESSANYALHPLSVDLSDKIRSSSAQDFNPDSNLLQRNFDHNYTVNLQPAAGFEPYNSTAVDQLDIANYSNLFSNTSTDSDSLMDIPSFLMSSIQARSTAPSGFNQYNSTSGSPSSANPGSADPSSANPGSANAGNYFSSWSELYESVCNSRSPVSYGDNQLLINGQKSQLPLGDRFPKQESAQSSYNYVKQFNNTVPDYTATAPSKHLNYRKRINSNLCDDRSNYCNNYNSSNNNNANSLSRQPIPAEYYNNSTSLPSLASGNLAHLLQDMDCGTVNPSTKPAIKERLVANPSAMAPFSSINSSYSRKSAAAAAALSDSPSLSRHHHHNQHHHRRRYHHQLQINHSKSVTHTPSESVITTQPKSKSPAPKKRKSIQKRVVTVAATAGPEKPTGECLPPDSWAWRKYGQKPIKGSPYPRSYYRCSSLKGCTARKQVERNPSDPMMIIVTYTSEHSHANNDSSTKDELNVINASSSMQLDPKKEPEDELLQQDAGDFMEEEEESSTSAEAAGNSTAAPLLTNTVNNNNNNITTASCTARLSKSESDEVISSNTDQISEESLCDYQTCNSARSAIDTNHSTNLYDRSDRVKIESDEVKSELGYIESGNDDKFFIDLAELSTDYNLVMDYHATMAQSAGLYNNNNAIDSSCFDHLFMQYNWPSSSSSYQHN